MPGLISGSFGLTASALAGASDFAAWLASALPAEGRGSVTGVAASLASALSTEGRCSVADFGAVREPPAASRRAWTALLKARRWMLTSPLWLSASQIVVMPVSYTHLRAHETGRNLVCRLLLE